MGAIQNALNQGINIAGALYTQSGDYQTKQQTAQLEKEQEQLDRAFEKGKETFGYEDPVYKQLREREMQNKLKQISVNPNLSEETTKKFLKDINDIMSEQQDYATTEIGRMNEANARAGQKAMARKAQRENITRHYAKLGGKK